MATFYTDGTTTAADHSTSQGSYRANVGILPPTGTAMSLGGWRFAVAVGASFILGALMCVGIGNYAPSMAILALLGMHPIAAYPIMTGSDGVPRQG